MSGIGLHTGLKRPCKVVESFRQRGSDIMPEGRRGRRPKRLPKYAAGEPSAARLYRDLCSTCNHIRTCGDHSTPQRPIFFCEQFEAFVPVSAGPVAASEQPPSDRGESQYKGLCINCETRQTCTTCKPEGGVWHCEEYR